MQHRGGIVISRFGETGGQAIRDQYTIPSIPTDDTVNKTALGVSSYGLARTKCTRKFAGGTVRIFISSGSRDRNCSGAHSSLWLANCYLASRRTCNIVAFCRGLTRIELVVADFKGIRAGQHSR